MKSFMYRITALIIVACMLIPFSSALYTSAAEWGVEDIAASIELDITPTEIQNDYDRPTTRAEFCRLCVSLLESVTGADVAIIASAKGIRLPESFVDTNDVSVSIAYALGIVNGTGNGLFKPNAEISRAEAAAMLMRMARLFGTYDGLPYIYDDAESIPTWARESVYAAWDCGLMRGDGMNCFNPAQNLTRKEAIVTAVRLYNIQNGTLTAQPFLYPMSVQSGQTRLWGYADKNGTFVISPIYQYVSTWNSKYGIVSGTEEGKYLLITADGKTALSIDSPELTPYFIGNTIVTKIYAGGTDTSSLLSVTGEELFRYGYHCSPLIGGYIRAACVSPHADKITYYLDRNGKKRLGVETVYVYGGIFHENQSVQFQSSTMGFYLVDKAGKKIDEKMYSFNEYMSAYGSIMMDRMLGDYVAFSVGAYEKFGVLKLPNQVILPAEYENLTFLQGGNIIAKKIGTGHFEMMNLAGKTIYTFPAGFTFAMPSGLDSGSTFAYDSPSLRYDGAGHYAIQTAENTITIIDILGKQTGSITGTISHYDFVNGLVQVDSGTAVKYYDVTGRVIIERIN